METTRSEHQSYGVTPGETFFDHENPNDTIDKLKAQIAEMAERHAREVAELKHEINVLASDRDHAQRELLTAEEYAKVLATQNSELRFHATTDMLTELDNRRTGRDKFFAELKRSKRHNTKMAVVYIDADNFKRTNDEERGSTTKHANGDRVLKELAHTLREGCRDEDIVSRDGGEEFLVVLTDLPKETDEEKLIDILKEKFLIPVKKNVKRVDLPEEELRPEDHQTVSIGGVIIDPSLEDFDTSREQEYVHMMDRSLKLADANLDDSKNTGKNKATVTLYRYF